MTTQNECQCGCDQSQSLKVPVCGLLELNLNGTRPAPAPEKLCRERVDHDVDIYINGNLEASGDGLTPETAVKSYGDAVLALSRYDGCNLYNAHFHFADLADPEAAYPEFSIRRGHYVTFAYLYISGESHTTTLCGACTVQVGSEVTISNICMTYIESFGANIFIEGKISIDPGDKKYGFVGSCSGLIRFKDGAEVFFLPGDYYACFFLDSSKMYNQGNVAFHTTGSVNVQYGFIYCLYNSTICFYKTIDFSGCMSVLGKKYRAMGLSCISSEGQTLPGTEPGVLQSGSVYI